MGFGNSLQGESRKEDRTPQMTERVVDISSTDIVQLNQCIHQMIDDDKLFLESSPGKAARFACNK